MPCKKLQIPPGPSVHHIHAWEVHLAKISDWNLKPAVASGERFGGVSGKRLVYSFYLSFLISETS